MDASSFADPDPPQNENLDPDQDPHQSQSQKQDPDPHKRLNSGAVEAQIEPWSALTLTNGAVDAQNVAWRVLRSMVADSHHFDEEQDCRIRDRFKVKSRIWIMDPYLHQSEK